ncbi:MAG: hypothetical protein QN178_16060 [Armatimonadota bacterium]|nr:hypothetical protein [Armatimonadota bacterium]
MGIAGQELRRHRRRPAERYELLASLKDPLGEKFRSAGLSGTTSPPVARNQSILAHGFARASDSTFERLWAAALSLADVDEASVPSFLTLGERAQQ